MRKILIVPEWYPWPDRPGLGAWVREQARALARENEVVVLASDRSGRSLAGGFGLVEGEEDGLRVVRVRYRAAAVPKGDFAARLAGMAAALRRLRHGGFEPDIVHAHVFSAGFPALLLARRSRAPLVVSEHYSGFPLGLLSRWDRAIARLTFDRAALVCSPSDELGRHLAAVAPRARLRTVPNAVDTEVFRPAPGGEPEPGGPVGALVVGALKERKGYPELLEALALVRGADHGLTVDLVGDGPQREVLEAKARSLGLGNVVRFRGRLDQREVAESMRRADFLVLPSLWENAPLAAIEALACGLPVVGSRVGGIPEIVGERAGLLVPPGDPDALAAAIREMSERHGDYDSGELAREARRRFGFEAVVRAWADVYDEAVRLR